MSTIGLIAVILSVIGGLSLIAAVAQLWALGGQADEPVGPWKAGRPALIPDPVVPREFRSLINGEAHGWYRADQWRILTDRLDSLEVSLGGRPEMAPAPEEYSAIWLHDRVARLESLTGPLPSRMPPAPVQSISSPKRFWKK